jgi:hypothetical protein
VNSIKGDEMWIPASASNYNEKQKSDCVRKIRYWKAIMWWGELKVRTTNRNQSMALTNWWRII